MRNDIVLPGLALTGGVGGFLARRWQLASAYVPETGLFTRGAPATLVLMGLLGLTALAVLLLVCQRREGLEDFLPTFGSPDVGQMTVFAASWVLFLAAGGFGMQAGFRGLRLWRGNPELYQLSLPASQLLAGGLFVLAGFGVLSMGRMAYRGELNSVGCRLASFPALAGLVWMLFRLRKDRSVATLAQTALLLVLAVLIMGFYQYSALREYKENIYDPLDEVPSDQIIGYWPGEIQEASEDTWLLEFITEHKAVQKLDSILSRRLTSASPSVEVFLEGGIGAKLLGVGYANTSAYGRKIHFMIEMDPPAILIRHGIVGFALYCVPYFAFIFYAIIQFFKRPLIRLSSLSYCTLLYCTLAGFAIAMAAGHALVSPAVSTFVLATGMLLWVRTQEQNMLPKGQRL